jgi:hypothetical protein
MKRGSHRKFFETNGIEKRTSSSNMICIDDRVSFYEFRKTDVYINFILGLTLVGYIVQSSTLRGINSTRS